MKRLVFVLAPLLLLIPFIVQAFAQCNGVFANNTVCGNITGTSNLPRPTNPSSFLGAAGGTNGQQQYNNGGALGGFTQSGDVTVNTSTGASTIQPNAVTTGKINDGAVTNGKLATNALPTYPSRATAISLDLSAFSAIQTLGYATAGDGGGATFRKIAAGTAFIDSWISTFSIQGGSGCTDGTYGAPSGSISTTSIIWTKSGRPTFASGTGTVSGGALTAASVSNTPGNAWVVGDVLSPAAPLTGCGVQPTITVTAVTTPLGSFTDAAGNKWQIVPQGQPNVRQFGAKGDWNGVDASATNDFNSIQAAAFFTAYRSSTSYDSGGFWGGKLLVPQGSYMMCGSTSFILPNDVTMDGGSAPGGATLHLCDAFSGSTTAFEICDPTAGYACFGTQFRNMTFHYTRGTAVTGGIFMLHSNNIQDFNALYNVYVYSGQRGCFHFEKGYGGASYVGAEKVSCNTGSPNNPMIRIGSTSTALNYGSTIVNVRDLVLGGPSSSPYQEQGGIEVYGGFGTFANIHCEIILNQCILLDRSASANLEQYFFHNVNSQGCTSTLSGSGSCAGIITLSGTNNPGNAVFGMIYGGAGYTHIINNGQPAGSHYNSPISYFARFNPSFVAP